MSDEVNLETFGDLLRHGYRLTGHCRPCGRHDDIDLGKLPAERPYIGAAFKCRVCGGSVGITLSRVLAGNDRSLDALDRWREG